MVKSCTASVIKGYLHPDLLVIRYEPKDSEVKTDEVFCKELYKKAHNKSKNNLRVFTINTQMFSKNLLVYARYEDSTSLVQKLSMVLSIFWSCSVNMLKLLTKQPVR